MLSDELRYPVMRLLEANPKRSQRDLARELGISLGTVKSTVSRAVAKLRIDAELGEDSGA